MWALHPFLFSLTILLFFSTILTPAHAAQLINITLPITSQDTTFSPFLCNSSDSSSATCQGAWRPLNQAVSTNGPDPATGNIIPQMFLSFRAHGIFVVLDTSSNATANMTVSTLAGLSVSLLLNSSLAEAGVVGLADSHITLLAISYIPSAPNSLLIIDSIFITVEDDIAPSSYLPSMSLPMSIPPLTYVPTSTGIPTASSSPHRSVNLKLVQGFSLVLGIGVGLSCVTACILIWWKKRRERKSFIGRLK